MNMRVRILRAVCALLCGSCCLPLTCSDPPNKPVVEQEYPFYFVSDDNAYYRFHPQTERVDTLVLPYSVSRSITVSADGKRLYLPNATSTVVLSTDSLSLVTELPYPSGGGIAVSPDGKLIAVQGRNLRVLSTTDYSIVYSDTIGAGRGVFSRDSKTYYALGDGVVFRLDPYSGVKSFRNSFSPRLITTVVPSDDETKLLMTANTWACTGRFLVFDFERDSIVFEHTVVTRPDHIVMTPDGRYAFVTRPWHPQMDCGVATSILIYDIRNNSLHREISTDGLFGDTVCQYCLADVMAITPDGKTLALCSPVSQGNFLIFDVATETFKSHYFLTSRALVSATCQNAL